MKNLIVLDEIKAYKRLYEGFGNPETFDQYVNEAQLLDIKKWLGDAFLLSLVSSRALNSLTIDEKNALYGCEYVCDGVTHFHEGIRASLAYFAHARFLDNGGMVVTQFGFVQKEDDYSRPVEASEVSRQRKGAIAAAEALKLDTSLFFARNAGKYPLYNQIAGRRTAARGSNFTIAGK